EKLSQHRAGQGVVHTDGEIRPAGSRRKAKIECAFDAADGSDQQMLVTSHFFDAMLTLNFDTHHVVNVARNRADSRWSRRDALLKFNWRPPVSHTVRLVGDIPEHSLNRGMNVYRLLYIRHLRGSLSFDA